MPNYSGLPVKMQGKFGTCGGHAGGALVSFFYQKDLSPKYVWKRIRLQDKRIGDVGTDMTTIMKVLQANGACNESTLPDTLDAAFDDYTSPATITGQMDDEAAPNGIGYYAFSDFPSFEQMKQAIFQNQVVIALVDVGDGWYINGWGENLVCPLRIGASVVGGHFIVLWGYDEKYIYFRNSWSTAWGRNGDGYFDENYVPHVREIGVTLPAISKRQQLVNVYTKLIYTLQQLVQALKTSKTAQSTLGAVRAIVG
jgi:hypothetical protein